LFVANLLINYQLLGSDLLDLLENVMGSSFLRNSVEAGTASFVATFRSFLDAPLGRYSSFK